MGEAANIKTEGNQQGKGKPCYCCCVKDIRFENLKPLGNKAVFGHSFDVMVNYEYIKADKEVSAPDCQLAWFEKTNRVSGATESLGAKPNEWTDMYELAPFGSMFHGWNSRHRWPGEEMTRAIPDAPMISNDSANRTLYFAMRNSGDTILIKKIGNSGDTILIKKIGNEKIGIVSPDSSPACPRARHASPLQTASARLRGYPFSQIPVAAWARQG